MEVVHEDGQRGDVDLTGGRGFTRSEVSVRVTTSVESAGSWQSVRWPPVLSWRRGADPDRTTGANGDGTLMLNNLRPQTLVCTIVIDL